VQLPRMVGSEERVASAAHSSRLAPTKRRMPGDRLGAHTLTRVNELASNERCSALGSRPPIKAPHQWFVRPAFGAIGQRIPRQCRKRRKESLYGAARARASCTRDDTPSFGYTLRRW
jgi:hypothetical protein